MWFNSTIQPATRAQSPLTDLFNRVKSATTPGITLPEKETSTREVRAQTWRYVAKVEASNNGGSRDDERSKLLHDIKFPFLRGAWNAQPARQWPFIKFRIPRALSLPSLFFSPFVASLLCKSVFTSPHSCKFNTLIARPFAGQSFLHRSLGPCNQLAKCACINADRSVQFTSTHSMTYNRAC